MSALWSLDAMATAMHAARAGSLPSHVSGISIDSRTLAKGDAVVVPAVLGEFSVRPQWSLEFLKAFVPGAAVPEPATRL